MRRNRGGSIVACPGTLDLTAKTGPLTRLASADENALRLRHPSPPSGRGRPIQLSLSPRGGEGQSIQLTLSLSTRGAGAI